MPGQLQFYQQQKVLPLHDELQLLKSSNWHTFSVLLYTDSGKPMWTPWPTSASVPTSASTTGANATRFFQPNLHRNVAEYFDQAIFGKMEREVFFVAMAAKQQKEVEKVLATWRVITLRECGKPDKL
jgi:hypothetical protein